MKRHSLLKSQLSFLHSETHLKMPFFNYSLQSPHFCPQTYKAQKSAYRFFYIILVCICPPLPQGHGNISVSVQWAFGVLIWSCECTAWEK